MTCTATRSRRPALVGGASGAALRHEGRAYGSDGALMQVALPRGEERDVDTTSEGRSTMSEQLVVSSVEGRLARIRLNRPDADNRITIAMMRQFISAMEAAGDAEADVLLITASGANFTVGRDQQERPPEGMTRRDNLALIVRCNEALGSFGGISLTAFRGKALGFGSGVVVQSDISVAADTASVGFDEIRHGFAPSIVMTYLEDYVGRKRAIDLVATGRSLGADEAERFGMVSRVAPETALDEYAEELAADLLSRDRDALRTCKSYLRAIRDVDTSDRGEYALDQMTGPR
jgi:methylglutaconyl-CoA hydratase